MLLEDIARKSAALSIQDCSSLALDTARMAIMDTIGVSLAGAREDSTQAVYRVCRHSMGSGPAIIFGQTGSADILTAALVNGTASHALDFDDCSNTLGGHPSAPIVPAIWALAEARDSKCGDVLAAYISGVEVEAKIGRAVNFHHYEKGWHPTATLGTFGSAAACSRLLNLDVKKTSIALGLAASMAAGLKANFGTMAKPFHVGQAARNGLLAALLAEEGMTANPGAMEDAHGFFEVFNGSGTYDPGVILKTWADPLDVIEPGIAFKRHPCCASTHPAIDALLVLREKHELTSESVKHIRSWTHPRRLNHTNRPDPKTGLDGKFSVQYVLARALLNGMVSLEHFSDAAVQSTEIREILQRITAEPHPEANWASTDHFYADVTVVTRDGQEYHHYVDRPVGRDRDHPMPEGALELKFEDCAARLLPRGLAKELTEQLLGMTADDTIREISAKIQSGMPISENK